MANRLKMAMVHSILTLHGRGWSARRIARELLVDRETVSRYVRLATTPERGAVSNPANAPISPAGDSALSNPTTAPTGGSPGRGSDCQPWREIIQAKEAQGLSARRIHQDLVAEHGATVSYDSVRRFVKRIGWTRPLPFRRMECAPGEEAQVDFGTGAPVIDLDGKRRRTHVFRIVLCHCRKAYSEAVYRQTTEDFLRALENAFWHFGGVPQTLVIDNLKAAVKQPDWFDPELNPKVPPFAEHYGTVILPTKPYTPRHKGKVERGVDYVQENGLKGRQFASLEEQNRHLAALGGERRRHADSRHDAAAGGQGLPRGRASRAAAAAGGAVPLLPGGPAVGQPRRPRRGGQGVLLGAAGVSGPRASGSAGTGGPCGSSTSAWSRSPCTCAASRARSARSANTWLPRRSAASSGARPGCLHQVGRIGEHAQAWAEAMLHARGIEGVRVLQGLLALSKRHPGDAVERGLRDRAVVRGVSPADAPAADQAPRRRATTAAVSGRASDHPPPGATTAAGCEPRSPIPGGRTSGPRFFPQTPISFPLLWFRYLSQETSL